MIQIFGKFFHFFPHKARQKSKNAFPLAIGYQLVSNSLTFLQCSEIKEI